MALFTRLALSITAVCLFLVAVLIILALLRTGVMANVMKQLAEPYVGFVLSPLIFAIIWVLKLLWSRQRGGWGITPYGFGVDHGIQISVEDSTEPWSDIGNYIRMPVCIQVTNTLEKRIRIRYSELRLIRDSIRHKEVAKCNMVTQNDEPFIMDCVLEPLEDSPKYDVIVKAPMTASLAYACLKQERLLFEFTVWRIPDTPREVKVLAPGIYLKTNR